MEINKISAEKRNKIIQKSVNPLPNNPSKMGYTAKQIKDAMYDFVTGNEDSVIEEVNRIVDETNANLEKFPTDLSGFTNNGTGTESSKYATIDYVEINGGKIDSISVNGTTLDIEDKSVNIEINKTTVGLNNVDNTSDIDKPVSNPVREFVNSSIATNTATFQGTYSSKAELEAYSGEKDDNDYAFVKTTDEFGNKAFDRYKYNGSEWEYEYTLNNSSFTQAQWDAINSGITETEVQRLANVNNYDDTNITNRVSQNESDIENLNNTIKTLPKLYQTLGQNTDGSITQKAVTDQFNLRKIVYKVYCGSFFEQPTDNAEVTIPNFPYTSFDDVPNGTEIEITCLYKSNDSQTVLNLKVNDFSFLRVLVRSGTSDEYYDPSTMGGWKANDVLKIVKGRSWMLTEISGKIMIGKVAQTTLADRALRDYDGNVISWTYAKTTDIPSQYLRDATVSNDILTITKRDGSKVEFQGGAGGGTKIIFREWT